MGLSAEQHNCLANEGLNDVGDFEYFKEDHIEQVIKNLRAPIPGIAAVTDAAGNVVTAVVPNNPSIPSISSMCSLFESCIYCFSLL